MASIKISTPPSLDEKVSELQSPSKPSPSIDFLELVNRTSSIMSTWSTNDDYSVRTEDDSSKMILSSDDFVFKASKQFGLTKDNNSSLKTLQEIATKRKYTRRNKTENDVKPIEDSVVKKRRLSSQTTAKNKEVIHISDQASTSGSRDNFPMPQVVIRDGVARLDKPNVQENKEIKAVQTLEVVEVSSTKVTTSSSFKKSRHTEKWTPLETRKFYRALELFGTDFSMIAKLFHTRNRNQIKNKFLKEEKSSADKVNAAFSKTKKINFTQLIKRFQAKTSPNKALTDNIINNNPPPGNAIRSQRSESFNSTVSLDSVDMSIMDDLADVFIPSATKQGVPSLIGNTPVVNVDNISLKIEATQ